MSIIHPYMARYLLPYPFMITLLLLPPLVWAQQDNLRTSSIAISSMCPGGTFEVSGTRDYSNANDLLVQVSNGGAYYEIPSAYVSNTGRYLITYRATLPAATPAGTYQVRLVTKDLSLIGTPSSTALTVKAKPAAPTGNSPQYDCQYRSATAMANVYLPYSTVYLTGLVPNSIVTFYDEGGSKIDFTKGDFSDLNSSSRSFKSPAYLNNVPGARMFRVTQTVDGCESEPFSLQLIIRPQPERGPQINLSETVVAYPNRPVPPVAIVYPGVVRLCQGSNAVPISAYHAPPPTGFVVRYMVDDTGETSTTPFTPQTASVGKTLYQLSHVPVNPNEGCPNHGIYNTYILVDVTARPEKPAVASSTILLCQSQPASALSASATVSGASLVWYDANGAPVSATPSTSTAGTFKYYVAQKLNDCESERAELTVVIKPTPAAPGVQSVAVCQNAPAPVLQPNGQNLFWYSSDAGGSGSSATPVVSTAQASQTTYYVSQSLDGCESQRAALAVTVHATPAAPTVKTGPMYCQNAPAAPLEATGEGLNWYREASGGTALGNRVIPETNAPGDFTYYVSQTVNGCEGSRSSLPVRVNPSPATPTATPAYSYCQKAPAAVLTATGGILRWYDASGHSSDTAPTPATDSPGTVSYFVSQVVDGCESQRAEIKITTRPTPAAPGTAAVALCQNEPARTLAASGQNLLWYASESGGNGSATGPTVNPSQTGQITYYVSQTLDGCEGPRAALSVTVKALPPAPGVAQRNICQFAPTEPVAATGLGLTWYNSDGNRFNTTPVINTDQGAALTYQVSQTVDGCEGPKATLSVNVLTTPAPTVARTLVELCQGATAQPLEATGSSLKWTDPNGVTATSAPVPPTVNATTKPEGDVYYVTQTGANTCESPRVAIRVFVQTVPTMNISGSAATNLGLEVPLTLTFTGVGPYQYRFSNGLSGTATRDTTILVLPERTTTYQVAEVKNKCGVGLSGATATVSVAIPEIQTLALSTTTLCVGTSLATGFQTSGVFNPGSVFKLQIAKVETDSTRINFVDLPNSTMQNGQISGVIPTTAAAGTYRVRVMATNPKIPINGTVSPSLLTIRAVATATLTGTQSIYEGESAKLSVAFTGESPWVVSYLDSTATGPGVVQTIQTTTNPYVLDVKPAKTTAYYLTAVSNACGNAVPAKNLIVVTVNPLLGIEDQALLAAVDVFPVPATTTLNVRIRGLSLKQSATLELTNAAGQTTWRYETRSETSVLPLGQQPAGTYLLRIRVGDRTASKRILKL